MEVINSKPPWYVGYTQPNCERSVNAKAQRMGYCSYLPLQMVIRQWSDRKKKLEIPFFPNYVFIKAADKKVFDLLQIPELIRFVTFDGKMANVNDEEIETIKILLSSNGNVFRENALTPGQPVRVTKGHFKGITGTLVKFNGQKKLVIDLHALRQGMSVYISPEDVEPIKKMKSQVYCTF